MKPIELVISAFGSFGGEEHIRFDQAQQGIFLVTGDTGAGKTTIFDAITYALYGQTSGGRRDGSMMRSQFAKEDRTTYVEYTFSNQGKVYTVYRQPEQMRLSRRKGKDGTYGQTKELAKVRLTLPDGMDFTGKGKETDAKICEILGLDVGQFTQIAMIAQGDFLKLLHAPSKERKAIFAKIFDTAMCEQVQMALEQRNKALYGQLEDNRKLTEHDIEGIRLPAGSAFAEKWKEQGTLSANDNAPLMTLLEAIQQEIAEEEQKRSEEYGQLKEQLRKLQGQLDRADSHNQLVEHFEQAKEAFRKCREQQASQAQLAQQIERGRRAKEVQAAQEDWTEKCGKLKEMQEKLQKIGYMLEELADQSTEKQRQKEEAKRERETKGAELTEAAVRIEQTFSKYENCQTLEKKYDDAKRKLEAAEKKETQIQNKCESIKKQAVQVAQGLEQYKDVQKDYYAWSGLEEQYRTRAASLQALLQKESVVKALTKEEQEKRRLYVQADKTYASLDEKFEKMSRQFLDAQAGIMAERLTDGEACPVCGSRSHPRPALLIGKAVKQSDVEAAKAERDDAYKKKEAASEACGEIRQKSGQEQTVVWSEAEKLDFSVMQLSDHEGMQEPLSEEECLRVEEAWQKLRQRKGQTGDASDEEFWEILHLLGEMNERGFRYAVKMTAVMQKRIQEQEELSRQSEQLKEQQETAQEQKQAVQQEKHMWESECFSLSREIQVVKSELVYPSLEEARKKAAEFRGQVDVLQKHFEEASRQLEEYIAQTESLKGQQENGRQTVVSLQEDAGASETAFYRILREQKFESVEDYESCTAEIEHLSEREQKLQEMQLAYAGAKASLESLEKQMEGKTTLRIDTEHMCRQIEVLQNQGAQLEEKLNEVKRIYKNNEDHLSYIRHALQEREELEKQYAVVNHLYKTANGKLTGDYAKLNFQTYMQRRYFMRVIREANKRLRIMSRQQFELRCRDMGALSRQGETGLDLDVYSVVTGQIRDVKTLSGGESFMAALSMALGMADIIQNAAGSVRLDTMFIDEGFGTLDDDSRREAIRILDELSGGKRLIGIISHVTELKEQIPVRLHVEKDEKGSRAEWR